MIDRKYLKPPGAGSVERAVFFSACRDHWKALLRAAVPALLLPVVLTASVRAEDAAPAPAASAPAPEASGSAVTVPPPAAPADTRDELVYNDGDHIRGKFVEKDGAIIVFKSERFGELHVAETDAKVVLAVPPAPGLPSTAPAVSSGPSAAAAMAAADADRLWVLSYLSPVALKHALQHMFGSWHGKFSFSTELFTDTATRNTVSTEATLQRTWTSDDVQLHARYDYSETAQVITTDILKTDGSWRHDLPHKLFAVYRPAVEWNRAYITTAGVPSDYLLLQQEIGGGVNIFAKPERQLRLGLSENIFNVWQTGDATPNKTRALESAFIETQWELPWRITVKDRGTLYYSVALGDTQGWENHFEIDKKLTETFSVGVQHELRHSQDLSVQDYRLLRLLIGLDF